MTTAGDPKQPPARGFWRSRWFWAGTIGSLIGVIGLAVAALPWWLGSPSGRNWLLTHADAALKPGAFRADSFSISWFGPTRITGLALVDHQGEPVLSAPTAEWDRNLWQILFQRPRLGTLTLNQGAIDVERDAEGRVDLYETLRPVIAGDPRLDLRVRIVGGRFRYRAADLLQPIEAERADFDLHVAPSPEPLTWKVTLARGKGAESITVAGSYDIWEHGEGKAGTLQLSVEGRSWPIRLGLAGFEAVGRLDGTLTVRRVEGRWASQGDAALLGLDVSGLPLAGDHIRAARAGGVWDVAESERGWTVARLDLNAPFATLRASGTVNPTAVGTTRVEGRIDLAAIAAQIPHALHFRDGVTLEQGTADLIVTTGGDDRKPVIDVSAKVSDLRATGDGRPFTLREPATFSARLVRPVGGAFQVESLSAESPSMKVTARGEVGQGRTTLDGRIDLAGLRKQLHDLVDLGSFELAGVAKLSGDYEPASEGFRGRLTADVTGLHLAGLGPLAVERQNARLTFHVSGRLGESGLPAGWTEAHARLESAGVTAETVATSEGSTVSATVRGPLAPGGRRCDGEISLAARWHDAALVIGRLELSLKVAEGPAPRPSLRTAAHGRFDPRTGELNLEPLPGGAGRGAVRIAKEGVRVVGFGSKEGPHGDAYLEGDLAALSDWLPESLKDLGGNWQARLIVGPDDHGLRVGVELASDDLAWGPRASGADGIGKVDLKVQAIARRDADRIDLSEVVLTTGLLTVEAAGRVDSRDGHNRLEVTGRVIPDWQAVSERLARQVEPGARVTGRPRPLKLSADLSGKALETFDAELGVHVVEADIFGLSVGETPLVVRSKGGKISIDPITVPVNLGSVHLEPEVDLDDEGGACLRLGESSTVTDVTLNERVSHRVLSFVAPVLDHATRVRGKVSVKLDEAVFPLARRDALSLDGHVVFQNVEFLPGSFLDPVLGLIGRSDRPLMRLDETVELSIADRRVSQRGLSLPIGRLSRIDMEGWVDFDHNLSLVASVPVVPTALANVPLVDNFVGEARIRVPIRGTLEHPQVDGEAFRRGMRETGESVLEHSMTRGAAGLFDLFTRPRDRTSRPTEPAQPRPTPRERRELRQKKQQERRRQRIGEP